MDERRLVGAGVIHDEVNVERCRHRGVDGIEEPAKLAGPVALVEFADDCAAPPGPVASAGSVACDRALESAISRPRRAPAPYREDRGTGRRYRAPCQ